MNEIFDFTHISLNRNQGQRKKKKEFKNYWILYIFNITQGFIFENTSLDIQMAGCHLRTKVGHLIENEIFTAMKNCVYI